VKRGPMTHDRVFEDEDFATTYAKKHKKMVEKFGHEYTAKLLSRGFQKGRIIDVGCGSGGTAIVLADKFPHAEVYGIDLSQPLLNIAKVSSRLSELHERIKFESADVHNIPYEDNSFDVVLSINMVHLVEDPVQMLNEMARILAPNGFVFIADLRRSWLALIEKEIKNALTLDEAKTLLGQTRLPQANFSSNILWWRFES
jgi:ubiquinone/menaquinone biosynthesis C-methylase UbiE